MQAKVPLRKQKHQSKDVYSTLVFEIVTYIKRLQVYLVIAAFFTATCITLRLSLWLLQILSELLPWHLHWEPWRLHRKDSTI